MEPRVQDVVQQVPARRVHRQVHQGAGVSLCRTPQHLTGRDDQVGPRPAPRHPRHVRCQSLINSHKGLNKLRYNVNY